MADTLERERLVNNLIDQVFRLEDRVRRLEEQLRAQATPDLLIPEPDTGSWWRPRVQDMGGDVGPVIVITEVLE